MDNIKYNIDIDLEISRGAFRKKVTITVSKSKNETYTQVAQRAATIWLKEYINRNSTLCYSDDYNVLIKKAGVAIKWTVKNLRAI